MWNDEIVEETRQVRDRYAAKFEYDLDAIYCDLKKQAEQDSEKFISLPPNQDIYTRHFSLRNRFLPSPTILNSFLDNLNH